MLKNKEKAAFLRKGAKTGYKENDRPNYQKSLICIQTIYAIADCK